MRAWPFSNPKTPGFGIAKSFYLTVLSSRPVLPSILDVVNPQGTGGAAVGFGAPLANVGKEALREPLGRGAYAIATKDRKTVLRMLVLSKDEAGYDPEAFARSSLAVGASPELLARMRATWTIAQLAYEAHDPGVYPALDFLLGVVARLATLTEGVVADAICQRYLLPQHLLQPRRMDPRIDARDHVAVLLKGRPDGVLAHTLGLQKFALPELEITGLSDTDQEAAAALLLSTSQGILLGRLLEVGQSLGDPRMPFQAAVGGFDRGLWEGIPVMELRPPTHASPSEALAAWRADS